MWGILLCIFWCGFEWSYRLLWRRRQFLYKIFLFFFFIFKSISTVTTCDTLPNSLDLYTIDRGGVRTRTKKEKRLSLFHFLLICINYFILSNYDSTHTQKKSNIIHFGTNNPCCILPYSSKESNLRALGFVHKEESIPEQGGHSPQNPPGLLRPLIVQMSTKTREDLKSTLGWRSWIWNGKGPKNNIPQVNANQTWYTPHNSLLVIPSAWSTLSKRASW